MRVKFALKNTLASVLVEIFTAISGIILSVYMVLPSMDLFHQSDNLLHIWDWLKQE